MFNHVCRKHLIKMFADLLPLVKEANDAVVVSSGQLMCAIKFVWPTSSFDVATTSLNSVRSALAFSTSLPENSDESTRSGTSDDGAVVGTAELAVPSVITVCFGRWDHRPRIVRRRNPNILEKRVQNWTGILIMPSVDGVVRVHAASTPKRKFRLVFALTTLLPWDAPARSMSGQHGHELGGPPSLVERTLLTDSLDRSKLPKTIASGTCQKTGATALRQGSRQQNSLMDKTTMLHLERLPKPHNYSDRFDFIEANRYCSGSKKKKIPGYTPQPNRGTTGQQKKFFPWRSSLHRSDNNSNGQRPEKYIELAHL